MRFFSEKEFYCPCGCMMGFKYMDEDLVRDLDRARGIAEVPFKINSSIRCKSHNKELGGTDTSSHLIGLAVDIKCNRAYERFRILNGLWSAGFTRIGIGKTFIHADQDTNKPKELIWTY